ncbi:hypothetical protein D9M69_692290 [compost metagenome]
MILREASQPRDVRRCNEKGYPAAAVPLEKDFLKKNSADEEHIAGAVLFAPRGSPDGFPDGARPLCPLVVVAECVHHA